jgi:hypothetical protein
MLDGRSVSKSETDLWKLDKKLESTHII